MEKDSSGEPSARIAIGGVTFEAWASTAGITRLLLPELRRDGFRPSREPLGMEIRGDVCGAEAVFIERLGTFLMDFMGGIQGGQVPAVDLDTSSDFTVEVLETVSRIPWGERRSYGWVAQRIGRPSSARAVGGALGRNPVPIVVPCHRVIRQDRSLGGFGAGLRWKELLLNLEQPATWGRVLV